MRKQKKSKWDNLLENYIANNIRGREFVWLKEEQILRNITAKDALLKHTCGTEFVMRKDRFLERNGSCPNKECIKKRQRESQRNFFNDAQNKKKRELKIKRTKLLKYGNENYCNAEKIKETKLKRYGNEVYVNREQISKSWTSKTKQEISEIVEKRREYNLKLYGVDWFSKTQEHRDNISKIMSEGIFNGIIENPSNRGKRFRVKLKNYCKIYKSKWEVIFQLQNPDFEYEALTLKYFKNNKTHSYWVDFINRKTKELVEIRSNYRMNEGNEKFIVAEEWCKLNGYTFTILSDQHFIPLLKTVPFEKYNEDIEWIKHYQHYRRKTK